MPVIKLRDLSLDGFAKVVTLLLFAWLGSSVLAHATLVLGAFQSDPVVPQAGEPFTLMLALEDPTEVPVEDAWVLAEFRPEGASEGSEPISVRFEETVPGRYETEVTLPNDGDWQLLLRDQTFRQEEARAELAFPVGREVDSESLFFVFPPTATGSQGLATWLIWVIILPIAAGIIVTVVVLRQARKEEAETV